MQQEKSVHKPMLDVEGQVQHLKDKGITFQLVNEEEGSEVVYLVPKKMNLEHALLFESLHFNIGSVVEK